MKGFYTLIGYMGYIDGRYYIFASEQDYIEAYNDYYKDKED